MRNITAIIIMTVWLSACSILGPAKVRHSKTTSLVNFLYPDGHIPNDLPTPVLKLPLRVGLAYVPENKPQNHITPSLKTALLTNIKHEFETLEYVQSIQIIPQIYLNPHAVKSTGQLSQIKQLYQLDVIALVSYDQIVKRNENLLAITYLTIVGNYIFRGSEFNVSTLIDMALIDLNSKRLLFRAAGAHGSKGRTAEAYTKRRYDEHQDEDFSVAMMQLKNNLTTELMAFEQRLRTKNPNDDITVESKKGFEMAVNRHLILLLMLLVLIKIKHKD